MHLITNLYANDTLLSADGSTTFFGMGCADCFPPFHKHDDDNEAKKCHVLMKLSAQKRSRKGTRFIKSAYFVCNILCAKQIFVYKIQFKGRLLCFSFDSLYFLLERDCGRIFDYNSLVFMPWSTFKSI